MKQIRIVTFQCWELRECVVRVDLLMLTTFQALQQDVRGLQCASFVRCTFNNDSLIPGDPLG